MVRYISRKFFKNKKSYILIIISLISFWIMSISPYLTGSFVDFLINNKDTKKIVYLSVIIMLVGLIGIILAYLKNIISIKITSQVSYRRLTSL